MSYEDLNILDELRRKGSITEEEYQREKAKVLNNQNNAFSKPFLGLSENNYLLLMHLSQFIGYIILGLGFAVPIIMWLLNKDNSAKVDLHGKNIINFMISMFIYFAIAGVLSFILIGIPLLVILGIIQFVSIILAAIKANNGEYWGYPISIKFLK